MDNYVKETIQIRYDIGLLDRFDNKDEIFKEYNTFNKRRRNEIAQNKF